MLNTETPHTMKAVLGRDYGDIDEMISVADGVPVPRLSDLPEKKRKTHMLIKTLAVSLAPGDVRVLSGLTREVQGPPSMPYVPGGDCAGIVVELPGSSDDLGLPFKVGDFVAARFVDGPRGALGEYALVSTKVADKVPSKLSPGQAAALAGASPAVVLAENIKRGERVLVLGAGGGMGSTLCQMLRLQGASHIVGVSRTPDRLLAPPIACNEAVDYTTTDVFSMEKFKTDKFDVIVDLAGGGFARLEACTRQNEPLIVKTASEGGRFITLVPPVGPTFEIHSIFQMCSVFVFPIMWKALKSRIFTRSELPSYTFSLSLNEDRAPATKILKLASEGKISPVLEKLFPFSTSGARAAFRKQESRHPQGKVVVQISADAN